MGCAAATSFLGPALRSDQIWSSYLHLVGGFLKLHSSPIFLVRLFKNPKKAPKSGQKPDPAFLFLTRQIRFSCDFLKKLKIGLRNNPISIKRLAGANTIRVISRNLLTSDRRKLVLLRSRVAD